jgi:uncharacterized protein
MHQTTRLYHGLPAVFVDGGWVIISEDFLQIATVPPDVIDAESTFQKLTSNGFFRRDADVRECAPNVSQVTLITTSDCNLRCGYCFANSGETRREMSPRIAEAAIRRGVQNATGRTLSIAFFGGEPTLTPELIRGAVSTAKEMANDAGIPVEFSITSNGVVSERFLDFLVGERFLITLSADGAPEVQDRQRPLKSGGSSSAVVARSIRRLTEAKAKLKIRATLTVFSVDRMPEMVRWVHSLGGTRIHFEPISLAGRALSTRGTTMERPTVEDFVRWLKASILCGNDLGVGIVNSSFMNMKDPPRAFCDGDPHHRFAITYDGTVTTCVEVQDRCHPASDKFTIGRFNEVSGELEIFKQRERATASCHSLVQLGTKGARGGCETCFAQRACGGGCPVRNFHTMGDSAVVDPYRCQTIQAMIPFAYELFYAESTQEARKEVDHGDP